MSRFQFISVAFLSLALCAYAVPSQSDTVLTPEILEKCLSAPTKTMFPDAKSVLLDGEKTIVLKEDGSFEIKWRTLEKVLTFMGKKELSNIKYTYDSSYEEMDITRARSISLNEDSTFAVAVSGSLEINDITAPGLSDAGIYAGIKQKVITIPGVVDSSIVEVGGTIRNFDIPKKPFEGIEFLGRENPVLQYRLIIEVPAGQKLIYESANGAPEPKIQGNRYIWTLSNYSGFIAEPAGPLGRDLMPCVLYTVSKNWTLAADYLQARFSPKAMPTEAITLKANQIAGELSGKAAADTLASWVSRNIRMVNISLGEAGFSPNSAEIVLKNSYADSRDRAVLLAAFLKARGMEPEFALLPPPRARIREKVPSLAQFNSVAVSLLVPGGERIWFWTEDDFARADVLPAYNGEKTLVASKGKGELISLPSIKPEDNGMEQAWTLTLDAEGAIRGEMFAKFRGDYERGVRQEFRDAAERRRKQGVESVVSKIGEGELAKENPFSFSALDENDVRPEMRLSFSAKEFAFRQGDMMIFTFPENPFDFAGASVPMSLDEREEPLVMSRPFEERYKFELRIPEDYRIVWMSEPMELSNSIGTVRVSSASSRGIVQYEISLVFSDTWIEPSEYEAAKKLLRAYLAPKNRLVLLEKAPKEQEDSESIEEEK